MKIIHLIIMSIMLTAATAYGQNSGISMGNSSANGAYSFAAGDNTVANGTASLAFGSEVSANGNYSFAAGNNSTTIGIGSTALGLNTTAYGDYSLAIGQGTIANGYASVAIGLNANTTQSGFGAVAIGTSSAQSPYSLAAGINNIARPNSDGSAIFGGGNVSWAASALVTGAENTAYSFGETIVGQYSIPDIDGTGAAGFVPTDRLFTVGNGANSSNRSNALVMLKNGDTDMTGNLDIEKRINVGNDDADAEIGDIRYNENTNDFEGYTNLGWKSLTAGSSTYGNNSPTSEEVIDRIASVGSWHSPSISNSIYAKVSTIDGTSDHPDYTDYMDVRAMELNIENFNDFLKVSILIPASQAAIFLLEGFNVNTTYDELEVVFIENNDVGTEIHDKTYLFEDTFIVGVDFKYFGMDGISNTLNKDQNLLYRIHFISHSAEITDEVTGAVAVISLNN